MISNVAVPVLVAVAVLAVLAGIWWRVGCWMIRRDLRRDTDRLRRFVTHLVHHVDNGFGEGVSIVDDLPARPLTAQEREYVLAWYRATKAGPEGPANV